MGNRFQSYNKTMKITIVTPWYNEKAFAPFFLDLYSYVDKIHIFLDKDTDDNTREICKQYDNVEIEEIAHPKGFCPIEMTGIVNRFVAELKSDWVYYLDPDEFIFPPNGESARAVLERQSANLLYAKMWQTWRHKTETDLDYSKPSVYQRRHGTPLYKRSAYLFDKPNIVKPEVNIRWHGGHHSYRGNKEIVVSEENFIGAHWRCADIDVAIKKRMEKHYRVKKKWGYQLSTDRKLAEEKMRKIFENHLDDSQMF